jgi:hypothetical protein
MRCVAFKPTIPLFQCAKTSDASNSVLTVIGTCITQCTTKVTKSAILEVIFLILKQLKNQKILLTVAVHGF